MVQIKLVVNETIRDVSLLLMIEILQFDTAAPITTIFSWRVKVFFLVKLFTFPLN